MRRRQFLKTCGAVVITTAPPAYRLANGREATGAADALHADVHPLIGTGWHGHMFPGAVAPFGMVLLSPDTSGAPEPKWHGERGINGWDHCSGYPDNYILGFSHTHLQGTGAADLGDLLLMPLVDGRNLRILDP